MSLKKLLEIFTAGGGGDGSGAEDTGEERPEDQSHFIFHGQPGHHSDGAPSQPTGDTEHL